ncbi:Homeodomain-interacting protein kinase 2 [Dissostichus eleginoides]|uniref:Homeodomain-interacting protein kinase 2 n=1 Tax=Dissostichus eleginoides TaxID=100907 RepID=A0AAD9C6Y9_DISEL|nr:Homeodomain-interacting protein kinase 2 [Dissostichus eleginoides]
MSSSTPRRGDFQVHKNDILSGESCKYLVRELKGQGTFGKVVSCVRLDTTECVAVKIIKRHLTWAGKKEAAAFKHISLLALKESNLVRFYESFMHKGHMCLVLEMLDQTLEDLMRVRRQSPLSEIRVVSQQMLGALKALKSIGLVHADIKPDNVMLVNRMQQPFTVKLIDFGCATPVSRIKRGTIHQTLGYRAPEVILGLPIDESADMWSLGCVLAYMYLSRHLYPIRCEYEVMRILVQMQGQPDDRLLDAGIHTQTFFSKNKDSTNQEWRLNTWAEYKQATGLTSQPGQSISNQFSCIDDLTKERPKPETIREHEDTRAFVSLLRRMLRVVSVTRVTPAEALQHSPETLPRDMDPDPYVTSSCVCPTQDSAAPHCEPASPEDPSSGNNKGSTSDAAPPTVGPADQHEVLSRSDDRSTGFVSVQTQRNRERGFCSVCCCCIQ